MSDNSGSTAAARLGASCGAIFVLAILVGNQMALDGYGGVDALADVARPQTVVNATGLALEMAGFVAFAFFTGWLVNHLRRGERDGWLATTAGVAAVTTLAIKLGASVTPIVAAEYRADVLSPELARTLHDLGDAGFVVSGLTFGVFVLAAAGSALRGRALPGWLGWTGVVIGALGLVTPTIGMIDPPNYNPLPFMAGLAWTMVVSVLWAVRAGRVGGQAPAAEPSAAASAARA